MQKYRYLIPLVLLSFIAVISCDFKGKEVKKESVGLYPVLRSGKWGYIHKNGEIVITPQFENAGSFHEGLALVQIGKKFGYIDKTGKLKLVKISTNLLNSCLISLFILRYSASNPLGIKANSLSLITLLTIPFQTINEH